jgi:hypothetical protein
MKNVLSQQFLLQLNFKAGIAYVYYLYTVYHRLRKNIISKNAKKFSQFCLILVKSSRQTVIRVLRSYSTGISSSRRKQHKFL